MHTIAYTLEKIVERHVADLQAIPESEMTYKPTPSKWSKKEILGHLIDSAQNNIRRFIVAQYEELPGIVYNQDKWVAITGYQQYNTPDLIRLWELINRHIVAILRNTGPAIAEKKCQTEDVHTIQWLAEDYIRHLLHHLHQVLNLEPVAYP